MANADGALLRTFSSIDDSLNLLLDDLKQEDGLALAGSGGGEGLQGLTPLTRQWALGADALVTATAAGGSAAALKGGSGGEQRAAPQPGAAPGFVPVPLPAKLRLPGSGSKAQPGGSSMVGIEEGSPSLQLHPSAAGSTFAIHAFGRPLTQLDFISTDDLDDEQHPAGPNPRSAGAPAAGDALFGSLGEAGRLGSGLPLASMDDLRRMAFDPSPLPGQLPDPMAVGSSGGGSGSVYLSSSTAFMGMAAPSQLGFLAAQPVTVPTNPFFPAAPAAPFGSYGGGAPAGGEAPHPLLRPALLRVRTADLAGSGEYSGGVRATSLSPVTGNLKRQLDGLSMGDSEAEGSPRGMKRHSSGSLWSEGSADNGGDTPRSSTPRGGQTGFVLTSSGSGPSRFSQEPGSTRRRPSGSSDDGDPAYTPGPSRQHRPGASRQQQQQQEQQRQRQQQQAWQLAPQALPAYQFQQAAFAVKAEDDAAEQAPVRQQYRGVSRHRLTQRWEASLWLNGRQLYLGGFNSQEDAARAYDLAALACKGREAQINFSPAEYADQLKEIQGYTRDEVVAYVRRRSSAFSRGKSRFRGVSGHNGRWEARIGSFSGRKNVSFGVFETEEDAARQYDRALILEKGRAAKTNFPMKDYEREVAEYEAHLVSMCGTAFGPATHAIASEMTLPRHREATADEKKRSAVIYAESLRCALAAPAPVPLPRAGRR